MNFREIDFHIHPGHAISSSRIRAHRHRINHIIDSIFLRMPRGLSTDLFSKLNVSVSNFRTKSQFWHFERIGFVEYFDSNAEDLLALPEEESVKLARSYLLRGISVAAKHDLRFATHLPTIRRLIRTAHLPYDYRTGVPSKLRGVGLCAELIIRIQARKYLWDVEIKGVEGIERLTLQKTFPAFPYFTRFKNLRLCWNDNRIQLVDAAGKVLNERVSKLFGKRKSIR